MLSAKEMKALKKEELIRLLLESQEKSRSMINEVEEFKINSTAAPSSPPCSENEQEVISFQTLKSFLSRAIMELKEEITLDINHRLESVSAEMLVLREEVASLKREAAISREKANTVILSESREQEVKSDLKMEFRKEYAEVVASVKAGFQAEILSLKAETAQMRSDLQKGKVVTSEDIEHEMEDRRRRRLGLIVSGVKEVDSADPAERQASDEQTVADILKHINEEDIFHSLSIRRIGRRAPGSARLIHLQCVTDEAKRRILRNKALLRSYEGKVFINLDLTRRQREEGKRLRMEGRTGGNNVEGVLKGDKTRESQGQQ